MPHFDKTRLTEVSEGEYVFEKELIDIFIEVCAEKLPQLEEALREGKHDESVHHSHDLKGSSSNIGAEVLRRISEKMEALCRESNYAEALTYYPQLQKEFENTRKVMEDYLVNHPGATSS